MERDEDVSKDESSQDKYVHPEFEKVTLPSLIRHLIFFMMLD